MRCYYLTQKEIKKAFLNVITSLKTNMISERDLTEKIAKQLHLTTEQIKSNHLTAFLVLYMNDYDYIYDLENKIFRKVTFNETAKEVIRGLDAAWWPENQIKRITKLIKHKYLGQVKNASLDPYVLNLNDQIIYREDEKDV